LLFGGSIFSGKNGSIFKENFQWFYRFTFITRIIDGKEIAKAMNNAANNQSEKVKIYQWEEINSLV